METIESCIQKVQIYLGSEYFHQPFFINVNSIDDFRRIKDELPAGMRRISFADYCGKPDQNPSFDSMINELKNTNDKVLLTDVIPALELQGESELQKGLSDLSSLSIQGKLVILCKQAMRYFAHFTDSRFKRRFIQLDGPIRQHPNIVFVSQKLVIPSMNPIVHSIQDLIRKIEELDTRQIFVISEKKKDDYLHSIFPISIMASAYDSLMTMDSNLFSALPSSLGTDEQWRMLLERFSQGQTWNEIVLAELGMDTNISLLIHNWSSWNEFQHWIYFVMLKINYKREEGYLFHASLAADSSNGLVRSIYREILKKSPEDADFSNIYQERKQILNALQNPTEEVIDFCLFSASAEKNAVYYLTNNTQQEKEKIIEYLGKYDFSPNELRKITSLTFPEIYDYLNPYHFDVQLFDDYFQQYKVQKVTNRIDSSFETLVEEQSIKREYNLVPTRCSVIEKNMGSDRFAYWVDALGVEFLGYLMARCNANGLMADITVCRANLPTTTFLNHEFVDDFANSGIELVSIKELDEVKHKGKDNYDYEKTKSPIHLIKELEIIDGIIKSAFQKLKSGKYKKAIIVSDHGASRLAVIKEHTIDFDVDSKGTHGGRCCVYNDSLPKIASATIEDDFYVLAGYDRFKGGRKASVETHGGATLEEVLVPVIVLSLRDPGIEVCFLESTILVSYRRKAAIKLFSKTELSSVSMCIKQKFYEARKVDSIWIFEMPDLTRPGIYYADIYEKNNLIAERLSFTIVKESARENDLI